MVGAAVLMVFFIMGYALIVEIFTVMFRLTGMSEEKARFQVISMLTSSGFTTSESEIVTLSVRRRMLARATLLFGYFFSVLIVSVIVNFFLEMSKAEVQSLVSGSVIFIVLCLLTILLVRMPKAKTQLDRIIEKLCNRFMFGPKTNAILLMDSFGQKVIATVMLTEPKEGQVGVSLLDMGIKRDYDIQILLVRREETMVAPIDGNTCLQKGDVIVAFGSFANIKKVFE